LPDSILLIPALFWIGGALHLDPEHQFWREITIRTWVFTAVPVLILTVLNPWLSIIVILVLLACAVIIARLATRSQFKINIAIGRNSEFIGSPSTNRDFRHR